MAMVELVRLWGILRLILLNREKEVKEEQDREKRKLWRFSDSPEDVGM